MGNITLLLRDIIKRNNKHIHFTLGGEYPWKSAYFSKAILKK
ncbi:Uncharacterised protein [Yersinia kristensenii]|nr:Uncharacterised protein [Yersinia kristensenii]